MSFETLVNKALNHSSEVEYRVNDKTVKTRKLEREIFPTPSEILPFTLMSFYHEKVEDRKGNSKIRTRRSAPPKSIPQKLTIPALYVGGGFPVKYRPISLIFRTGDSPDSGHYTMAVR